MLAVAMAWLPAQVEVESQQSLIMVLGVLAPVYWKPAAAVVNAMSAVVGEAAFAEKVSELQSE
jgi:hypothetical protein